VGLKKRNLTTFVLLLLAAASCGDETVRPHQCALDTMNVCHCTPTPGDLDPRWKPVAGCHNYSCCFFDLDLNNGDCSCVNVLSSRDPNGPPVFEPLEPMECLRRVPVTHARVIDSCPNTVPRAR
jgi:hypothetical protein